MSRLMPYVVSVVAVAAALGLRLLLNQWLGENRPFLLFVAAVAVSAWFGGTSAGIFSVALAYLAANVFLIPPIGMFSFKVVNPVDWVNLLTFVCVSAFVVGPIAALRRSQAETEASAARIRALLQQAEQEDRHKDRFLATLSHELRGPLASLTNALELLAMCENDRSTIDQVCPLMGRQVHQMTRLIDDLMDVSRIAQGRIQLERGRVDLSALVLHAVEAISPTIADRGHQLHVDVPPEPLAVEGDEVRLTQVFSNLLNNATKYSGRGGAIWVTARRDQDRAVVSVRDNGPGIPREKLGAIFEMFSQLESTLQRAHGGLGIGLFLARQVVELHHGQIEALSDGEGRGAEFVVRLPCRGVTPRPSILVASPAASNPGA